MVIQPFHHSTPSASTRATPLSDQSSVIHRQSTPPMANYVIVHYIPYTTSSNDLNEGERRKLMQFYRPNVEPLHGLSSSDGSISMSNLSCLSDHDLSIGSNERPHMLDLPFHPSLKITTPSLTRTNSLSSTHCSLEQNESSRRSSFDGSIALTDTRDEGDYKSNESSFHHLDDAPASDGDVDRFPDDTHDEEDEDDTIHHDNNIGLDLNEIDAFETKSDFILPVKYPSMMMETVVTTTNTILASQETSDDGLNDLLQCLFPSNLEASGQEMK